MATVHMIWWGNPNNATDPEVRANQLEGAMSGPRQLAQAIMGTQHELVYWHQQGWTPLQAGGNITLRPLTLEQVAEMVTALPGLSSDTKTVLTMIFNTFDRRQAFAQFKDLLSLCVLYQEGGFFFDTTIAVDEEVLPDNLTNQAAQNGAMVRFMARYLDTGSKNLYRGLTPVELAQGPHGGEIRGLPQIEVSAIYAPPGSEFIREMIAGYAIRCCVMKIHMDQPIELVQGRPVRIFDADPNTRKQVLGNIVQQAVYGGLILQAIRDGVPAEPARNDRIKEYCWGAIATDGFDHLPEKMRATYPQYMPQLGITKRSMQIRPRAS